MNKPATVILFVNIAHALSDFSVLWLLPAVLGYAVHWLGDSLDGTLARVRSIERPRFGMFIDQAADVLTTALILGGLGLSPWIRFDVAVATFAGYLLLAVLVHLRAGVIGVYDIAHDGIGPTEGRFIMVALSVGMALTPVKTMPDIAGFSPFDLVLLVMVAWACVTFAREVIRVGQILAREEPSRTAAYRARVASQRQDVER
ncbi:membrane hypothetical protein [Hyphomicrobiales bacterium]|nr:membrane hypothetical protein [Hyphomicrobiales bacterium]CAH1697489.1 membrane hypothetical protein [Hyphomicrobiales bacterium]CAI0345677.1 membrane hypothetical protein [Hyphomicrobiales bacterium]